METNGQSHVSPIPKDTVENREEVEVEGTTPSSLNKSSEMITLIEEDIGIPEDIVTNVDNAINKCDVGLTVSKCIEETMLTIGELKNEYTEVDANFKLADNILQDAYMKYSLFLNMRQKKLELVMPEEVNIDSEGTIEQSLLNIQSNTQPVLSRSSLVEIHGQNPNSTSTVASTRTQPKEICRKLGFISLESVRKRKPGPASRTGYYSMFTKGQSKNEFELVKPPDIIKRPPPKAGDIAFGMLGNLLTSWRHVAVLEETFNKVTNQPEYVVVRINLETNNQNGIDFDEDSLRVPQLCLKQLAYTRPCPFLLPVGSRILAKYKYEVASGENNVEKYYAGMIAEPTTKDSRKRYLVFFDDGYAQYVKPVDVFIVCESSMQIWNDMYPDCYDFIKAYMKKWPFWPMVKLSVGQMIAAEWNGMWSIARVTEVDNRLVKVRFDNDGRDEWIYRGSARLRPVTRQMVDNQREQSQQMSSEIASAVVPPQTTTGVCEFYKELLKFTGRKNIDFLDPSLCIEYQGTLLRNLKSPAHNFKPKDYLPHNCDHTCVQQVVQPVKGISPLAVPFLGGWAREVCRNPRRSVFYRSPCGTRLRNDEELAKYLDYTNSNLTQDYFSFDYDVDCLSVFTPARILFNINDISNGVGAPVHAVNSFDYDPPPDVNYISHRSPGPGVTINLDENFLSCCECTDNCQDRKSCTCLQLTQEGISFQVSNDDGEIPLQGYENRRLKTKVISGIYECNNRCKCKQTCSNRTTQNGAFWPLQLFKTAKKGWAVRTVYDMPLGTFVCVYAGEVLNDRTAETVGQEVGDEYFAQLDYIEMCERHKPDYESDVTDIEQTSTSDEEPIVTKKKVKTVKLLSSSEEEGNTSAGMEADKEDSDSESSRTRSRSVKSKLGNMTARKRTHFGRQRIVNQRSARYRQKRRRIDARCQLYGPNEEGYILDAKNKGNVGRYLNHSCSPNVTAQNVFVETHDIRFPHIALFTNQLVKAGSELTWDYCYTLSSAPEKILYCLCNTRDCRGRLM